MAPSALSVFITGMEKRGRPNVLRRVQRDASGAKPRHMSGCVVGLVFARRNAASGQLASGRKHHLGGTPLRRGRPGTGRRTNDTANCCSVAPPVAAPHGCHTKPGSTERSATVQAAATAASRARMPGKASAKLLQHVAHQTAYLPQRMSRRYGRLRRYVREQRSLIAKYPPHPCPLLDFARELCISDCREEVFQQTPRNRRLRSPANR
jgi:hypothetical protein